jgi:serine/threonine-protein kinase
VAGESLGQMFRERGTLPARDVARWAADAARGLAHAHAQGIVHRDIKPSNLMLGEDGRVRVLDLGLGTLLEADAQASFATADGIAVGTVDYMSPEQAMGKEVDGRSDLYSLGCTMYHLIGGRHVFPGASPLERLGQRINGKPAPLASVAPGVTPALAEVLDRLMANKPADRFADGDEAAEALQAAAEGRRPRDRAEAAAVPEALRPPKIVEVPVEVEVEVHPEYPGWFLPLANLAEHSPGAALATCILIGVALLAAGFVAGLLLHR